MQAKISGEGSNSLYLPTRNSMPCGMARVVITAKVCGKMFSSTKTTLAPAFCWVRERRAYIMVTASAAAVASSSSEQLASGIAVRSQTAVWKFINASSIPCDTSV